MPDEKRKRILVVDRMEMAETVTDGLRDQGYDAEPVARPRRRQGMRSFRW